MVEFEVAAVAEGGAAREATGAAVIDAAFLVPLLDDLKEADDEGIFSSPVEDQVSAGAFNVHMHAVEFGICEDRWPGPIGHESECHRGAGIDARPCHHH